MTNTEPKKIAVSPLSRCAAERCCFPIAGKHGARVSWARAQPIYLAQVGEHERAFIRVSADVGNGPAELFMDGVTGALFRESGECLSTTQLHAAGFRVDSARGEAMLLAAGKNSVREGI